jgi:hypothetical protein
MNFLAYPDSILSKFRQYFDEFIATSGRELKNECYLPKASDWFIKNGYLKMRVLKADSEWFGVTYKEDKDTAIKRLAELTRAEVYPDSLWS